MITISYRHFNSHIKSLVHFDYPYYKETGDGLGDDILGSGWTRAGNILLAGAEIPADKILTAAPKFGYRCLYSENASQYIFCKNGAFSLDDSSSYEFSFWLCLMSSQAGQVLGLYQDNSPLLTLTVNTARQLSLSAFGSSILSEVISSNEWHYVQVRMAADSMSILINGRNSIDDSDSGGDIQHASFSTSITRTALPADECRLGGFYGLLDEFMFSDTFFSGIPTEPHQAQISLQELGGSGSGALGDAVISSNIIMNTTAAVNSFTSRKSFSCSGKSAGNFGDFRVGDEVMLLCLDNTDNLGKYSFRTITAISAAGDITLDRDISEFDTSITPCTKTQIISVPHFNSLTISANAEVKPKEFADNCGGIVAFRVKNDCTINGKILTHGTGPARTDNLQMTHAGLIDRFLVGSGGGIFIVCGGKFTLSENARLGASWDGTQMPEITHDYGGKSGGSGYGGGGGQPGFSKVYDNNTTTAGGVGRAGSGAPRWGSREPCTANGNFPGKGNCGACLVLLTKTLAADFAAISTGGGGGGCTNYEGYSGGGTGFAFIACEKFIS